MSKDMSKDIYRLRRFACSRWNLTWVKSQYDGADLRHDYHQLNILNVSKAKKFKKSIRPLKSKLKNYY